MRSYVVKYMKIHGLFILVLRGLAAALAFGALGQAAAAETYPATDATVAARPPTATTASPSRPSPPDLTVTVPVRPDGKISTPLVEDIVAVGKTPSELARDVEKALGEYVKAPQVNVIVTQPASVFGQIKVIGQVQHPQALAFRE